MNKIFNFIKDNKIVVITFIFTLIVSVLVPLLGDDWGNVCSENNLKTYVEVAIGSFKTFEGRFFSRIMDLIFVNNKWLWNIANPIMMSLLVYFIIKIIKPSDKNKRILSLLVFLGIFLVDKEISNQVYFWVVGNATYFVPMLYAIFLLFIYNKVFEGNLEVEKWQYVLLIPSFIFSLFVENVSVGIITINLVLFIVNYKKTKRVSVPLILSTVFSIIGTVIMMTSPGTKGRMETIELFYSLNLLEKIQYNLKNLIYYTFVSNPFIVILLTVAIVKICNDNVKNKYFKWFEIMFFTVIPLVTVFCYNINYVILLNNLFLEVSNVWIIIYWILYIINFVFIILKYYKEDNKIKVISCLIVAMSSNGAMMLSPIWGGRTALFTTIAMLVTSLLILNKLDIDILNKKWFNIMCNLGMICCVILYIAFYAYTSYLNNERHEYIKEQLNESSNTIEIIALPSRFLLNSNLESEWHEGVFKNVFNIDENKEVKIIRLSEKIK